MNDWMGLLASWIDRELLTHLTISQGNLRFFCFPLEQGGWELT